MSSYINFKINGKLFPLWILKNFKDYKLEPVFVDPNKDPCEITTKLELHKYQTFLGSYLDFKSPFREILIYHGLGSGKTASAINIYNSLYNYNPEWNVIILIKASLKNDPWLKDLNQFLQNNKMMDNIKFVHYDSPYSDRDFVEAMKTANTMNKYMFIIDEAHNFISNVYNNINTKTRRAKSIYDAIITNKTQNSSTRIILLSGTPMINNPFEIALMFNLMRPGIFPTNESTFNEIYVSKESRSIRQDNKNKFQRKILGLVSYYIGATKDRFATKKIHRKKLIMSKYHKETYEVYEEQERQIEKNKIIVNKTSTVYKSYTRQAGNFVFPNISDKINGENRPRPRNFKISFIDEQKLLSGKEIEVSSDAELYLNAINKFIDETRKYFNQFENKLIEEVKIFMTKYNMKFEEFWEKHKKSKLLEKLYECSPKFVATIFISFKSKGPVYIYTNYVKGEGIEIIKIYLDLFGFQNLKSGFKEYMNYVEYHGDIDEKTRLKYKLRFNNIDNATGKNIRILLLSAAGAEGIELRNVRQTHILEPYWNETRITQVIGRGLRQCSHKDLPMKDRVVDIYRYMVSRGSGEKATTDELIDESSNNKEILINSFRLAMKEAAVDCNLFKNHNMIDEKYECFQFNEPSYFVDPPGPIYRTDNVMDDNGLNSQNSELKKIKIIKIKGKYEDKIQNYWYSTDTNTIYDFELEFPIGKILLENGMPVKIDKETYVIDKFIQIPLLK